MRYLAFGAIVAANLAVAGLAQDMSATPDSDVLTANSEKNAADISYSTLVDCAGYYSYMMSNTDDDSTEKAAATKRMSFFSDAAVARYPENNEETVILATLDSMFIWVMMSDDTRPEELSAKEAYCRNLGDTVNGTAA